MVYISQSIFTIKGVKKNVKLIAPSASYICNICQGIESLVGPLILSDENNIIALPSHNIFNRISDGCVQARLDFTNIPRIT